MDLKIIKIDIFHYLNKVKDLGLKCFNYLRSQVQIPEYDCFILVILFFLITPLSKYTPFALLGHLLLMLLMMIKCIEIVKQGWLRCLYIFIIGYWFFYNWINSISGC